MSDSFVATPGAVSWAYDPGRKMIDYVTADGTVHGYDLTTGLETLSVYVGGTPGKVAITPDDRYLLIANTQPILTSSEFAPTKTYVADIARLDLSSREVQHIQFSLSSKFEGGVYGLSVTGSGEALVTTRNEGGATYIRSFTASAATPAVQNATVAMFGNQTTFIVDNGGRLALVEEGNISDAHLDIYSTLTDKIVASRSLYDLSQFQSIWQRDAGSISEATNLVADVLPNNVFVFDTALNLVKDLSSYAPSGSIADATFSKDGRQLFLWQGAAGHVAVLDTTTWQQVGSFDVAPIGYASNSTPYKSLLIGNGYTLALSNGSRIELVSLTDQLPGTGQAFSAQAGQSLLAGNGDDTISGSDAGANDIRGYYGNDSIMGGSQYNLINGNQGADTIVGHSTVGDSILGGQGNDLIDLVGSRAHNDVNGNIGSDTIHGGSGGDTLRGGQGDDLVVGGSGADWISGDRGNDTLTSGGGGDTFHMALGYGSDQVTDFNYAEGDRVIVDHGAIYTLSMSGADTLVDLGGGDRMLLKNITLSSLPTGWITQT